MREGLRPYAPPPCVAKSGGPVAVKMCTETRPGRRFGSATRAGTSPSLVSSSRAHTVRWTFVLEAWARGRTTRRSMLTWLGRVTAQPIVSATSSAVSGASTPA